LVPLNSKHVLTLDDLECYPSLTSGVKFRTRF